MDVFEPRKRSEIMSRIRSKNTKAELTVFRYLSAQKIYFQKHYERVAGKPDVALPRKKRAVFIDGDFWHGREYGRLFKTRPPGDYWLGKIKYNIDRDLKTRKILEESGWKVLQVWETDIIRKRTQKEELERIAKFLKT